MRVVSGKCLCILISYFLLISIQSLPLANGTRVEENCQQTSQSFLDSSPFFRMAPSRFQSQQILFLTEFSRFMNRHAPTMMKEFVGKKQIYQAERTLQKLKRYNPETVLNELGDEVEARTTPIEEEEVEPVLTGNPLMPRKNRSMVSSITDSRLADPEAYQVTSSIF
eukprot:11644.XXX_501784_501024_1 [CDS] Oithona nana genome sequencing.